jgi:hypothetical protein
MGPRRRQEVHHSLSDLVLGGTCKLQEHETRPRTIEIVWVYYGLCSNLQFGAVWGAVLGAVFGNVGQLWSVFGPIRCPETPVFMY